LIDSIIGFIAFEHFVFLILEMFLWNKPLGRKIFSLSQKKAIETRSLAANQGLYNGFLSAGLIWGLVHTNHVFSQQLNLFFLVCVVIAGIFGALSVSKKIFFIQALPAIIALILMQVQA